jgi:hypothetical protein
MRKQDFDINIVTYSGDLLDGVFDWMIAFIELYTIHSELQAITELSLFPQFTVNCYTHQ